MKIGLLDVDSHNFPNLALMKISSYHKALGDEVEMASLFNSYDIIYQSKIFTFTEDFDYFLQSPQIIKGGTGYDLKNSLPEKIERCFPDYSLYNIPDTAYGYLTRGCPRACGFCIVADKEGKKSYKVSNLDSFWNGHKEIKLLDPNLLACKDRVDLLQQLIESKAWVDFTQGLDARCLTDEVIELIKCIKIKMIHFAWDNMKDSRLIIENLKKFKTETKYDKRKLSVYVLTNYDTTIEEDLYRIDVLKKLGYDPYLMIYEKWKAPDVLKKMQRWVNNKIIFRSCEEFSDYKSN
jgi:hypothetical protein